MVDSTRNVAPGNVAPVSGAASADTVRYTRPVSATGSRGAANQRRACASGRAGLGRHRVKCPLGVDQRPRRCQSAKWRHASRCARKRVTLPRLGTASGSAPGASYATTARSPRVIRGRSRGRPRCHGSRRTTAALCGSPAASRRAGRGRSRVGAARRHSGSSSDANPPPKMTPAASGSTLTGEPSDWRINSRTAVLPAPRPPVRTTRRRWWCLRRRSRSSVWPCWELRFPAVLV